MSDSCGAQNESAVDPEQRLQVGGSRYCIHFDFGLLTWRPRAGLCKLVRELQVRNH